jgi:hypothetical protein
MQIGHSEVDAVSLAFIWREDQSMEERAAWQSNVLTSWLLWLWLELNRPQPTLPLQQSYSGHKTPPS